MDINYHYFAVKTLARFSGFSENDAQLLAAYSQFIDDYDLFFNLHLDDVPGYARHLAVKGLDEWTFKPVTTGFRRAIDFTLLGVEANQRNILVPFHFIPWFNLKHGVPDRAGWRTKAVTRGDGSLMDRLLGDARDAYISNTADRYNLMRIGMLLHTFADTHAHQGFSGFYGWENERRHTHVIDNTNGSDISGHYSSARFPIAHAEVFTAPDDSHVRFTMQHKPEKDGPFVDYERDNTESYKIISREIVNYLQSCRQSHQVTDATWNDFEKKLSRGFLTSLKENQVNALCSHWKSIFPEYIYLYNRDELLSDCFNPAEPGDHTSFKSDIEYKKLFSVNQKDLPLHRFATADQDMSEDFFHFNVLAYEIREKIKGNMPIQDARPAY